jgi:hypothetical protein
MNKVTAVQPNDDYSLNLQFSDGCTKRFDVKPYLDFQVFHPLRDPAFFKQVRLAFGTVQWPNEADISPDTLYMEGQVAAFDFDEHRSVA